MKKELKGKTIAAIMIAIMAVTTMTATVSMVNASAAETDSSYSSKEEKPTCDKEPGIYPIDADHFMIVYKDRTFRIVHGEPPTTRPWTIDEPKDETKSTQETTAAEPETTEPATTEPTSPTTNLQPGKYPIDHNHYLLVNPDHTFTVVFNPQ